MANYGILLTDNGDTTWTITTVMRAPTTTTITGGTSLLTNTFTQSASTGALLTASGFKVSATDTGDGLGHQIKSPQEALARVISFVANDRAFNG